MLLGDIQTHVSGISVNAPAHKSTRLALFRGALLKVSLRNAAAAAGPPPTCTRSVSLTVRSSRLCELTRQRPRPRLGTARERGSCSDELSSPVEEAVGRLSEVRPGVRAGGGGRDGWGRGGGRGGGGGGGGGVEVRPVLRVGGGGGRRRLRFGALPRQRRLHADEVTPRCNAAAQINHQRQPRWPAWPIRTSDFLYRSLNYYYL